MMHVFFKKRFRDRQTLIESTSKQIEALQYDKPHGGYATSMPHCVLEQSLNIVLWWGCVTCVIVFVSWDCVQCREMLSWEFLGAFLDSCHVSWDRHLVSWKIWSYALKASGEQGVLRTDRNTWVVQQRPYREHLRIALLGRVGAVCWLGKNQRPSHRHVVVPRSASQY